MVAHLPLQRYRCIIFDTRGSGSNAATYAHCMRYPTLSATLLLLLIHRVALWPRRRVSHFTKTATSHSSAWPTT
jgi:hypothetical protein